MNEFYSHVFYDIDKLSWKDKKDLLHQALSLSQRSYVQILDCSKSWSRENTNISPFHYIEHMLSKDDFFTFIHRRGSIQNKNDGYSWIIEIGSCTLAKNPDYFLYIFVDESELEPLIRQYGLEETGIK